jgi:hypothetical protein
MSKIHGPLYYYLTLWAWGTCALMVLAVCWTAVELVARARRDDRSPVDGVAGVAPVAASQLGLAGRVGLVAGTVLFAVMMCSEAASVEIPVPRLNAALGGLVAPTISALRRPISGERSSGRVLVTWTDPIALGNQAWGLMDQLDRAGFRIGVLPPYRGAVPSDELVSPSSARVVVHVAVGQPDISLWRAKPGVRQVAFVDLRTPAQRAEFERLRSEVIADLKAAHLTTLAHEVDFSILFVLLNENVPVVDRNKLKRMADLGLPVAVFVGPGSAAT